MSNCSNCFNGCAETTSDQCVKYTGPDVPALGISDGDSLASVQQAIIDYLVPILTGVGVKPIIENSIICESVSQYLPNCTECNGFTLNEVLSAIIQATCAIQEQVDTNTADLNTLNADYSIGCLTGVTSSSDTHSIVQAVINNLCSLNSAFTTLVSTVLPNTYVPQSQINQYIAAYLESQNFLALAKDKMVPYVAVEYYGPLSGYPTATDSFSLTGAGTGYWQNVYLCNGLNGTPDKRGRVAVGVVTGMGGGALDPEVDPGVNPANPNYTVSPITGLPVTKYGANYVNLNIGQMPAHNHPGSSVAITDPGHTHTVTGSSAGGGQVGGTLFLAASVGNDGNKTVGTIIPDITGITATPTISSQGGGEAHNNVQPSRACFYIMYIP